MRKMTYVAPVVIACLAFVLVPFLQSGRACAQATATTGQGITGSVVDTSGAPVPGATIVARNIATGVEHTSAAGDRGFFSFPGLVVGPYRLTVTQDGFETLIRENVTIVAGQTPDVRLELTIGSRTEQIVVTAGATLDKTTTATAQAIPAEALQDLPVVAGGGTRSPLAYLAAYGGISLNINDVPARGADMGLQHSTIFGVGDGGGFGSLTSYKVDGLDQAVDQTQPFGGTFAVPKMPAPSAVQEVRVLTNTDAEQGFNLGAVYELITKSGTARYRGELYEYARNDALNARNFLAVGAPPKQNQHDFGATYGGPIPGLGGNGFFFVNYQAFRSRFSSRTATLTVPTAKMRQGDFSEILGARVGTDALGRPVFAGQIFDPRTTRADGGSGVIRDPFPNNTIPADRFSSVSKAFLASYPLPNLPGVQNNYVANSLPNRTDQDKLYLKTDHVLTPSQRLSVGAEIFFRNGTPGECGNALEGPANFEGFGNDINNCSVNRTLYKAFRVNYTNTLRPNLLVAGNIGIAYAPFDLSLSEEGLTAGERAGLRGTFTGGTPVVSITDMTGWGQGQNRYAGAQWILPVDLSLTWMKSAHQFKFGMQFNHVVNAPIRETGTNGTYGFTGAATRQPGFTGGGALQQPGYGFADFLLGVVNSANVRNPSDPQTRTQQYAWYAQDNWRATRRLTINYGVRWELFLPSREGQTRWANFCPTCPNPAAGGRPGALEFLGEGEGRTGRETFWKPYPWAIAPRLGVAYTVTDRIVTRFYYGMSRYPLNTILKNGTFYPDNGFAQIFNQATTDGGITPVFANWDVNTFNTGAPIALNPSSANNQNVSFYDYADNVPYPQHGFGASVEREFGGGLVLGVKYAGKLLRNIPTNNLVTLNQLPLEYLGLGTLLLQNINSPAARAASIPIPYPGFNGSVAQALLPYPQYQIVNYNTAPAKDSNWHALIVSGQQRSKNGLSLLANYTLQRVTSNDPLVYSGNGTPTYAQAVQSTELRDSTPFQELVGPGDFGGSRRHTANITFSYNLPIGAGQRIGADWHPVVDAILGGWGVAAVLHYASGTRLAVTAASTTPTLRPWAVRNPDQPLQGTATCSSYDPGDPSSRYVNPLAFSNPAQFTLGDTLVIDGLNGCGIVRENLSLFKTFRFGDGRSIKIGADVNNLFNRHSWNGLTTTVGSANFGRFANVTPGRAVQIRANVFF